MVLIVLMSEFKISMLALSNRHNYSSSFRSGGGVAAYKYTCLHFSKDRTKIDSEQ